MDRERERDVLSAQLPVLNSGTATDAVFGGLVGQNTLSPSQNWSCRRARAGLLCVRFPILFEPLSFVSSVLWSWPLLLMLCEDLLCQLDGLDPPTKGMPKL